MGMALIYKALGFSSDFEIIVQSILHYCALGLVSNILSIVQLPFFKNYILLARDIQLKV